MIVHIVNSLDVFDNIHNTLRVITVPIMTPYLVKMFCLLDAEDRQ